MALIMTLIARADQGSISVCPNQGHIWAHSQLVGKIRNYWLLWWAPTQFNSFIHSTTKNKCNGFHYYYTTAISFIQLLASVVCFFPVWWRMVLQRNLRSYRDEMALYREKVNGTAYGHCIALGTKGTSCVRHWECNHVTQQLDISMTRMS